MFLFTIGFSFIPGVKLHVENKPRSDFADVSCAAPEASLTLEDATPPEPDEFYFFEKNGS